MQGGFELWCVNARTHKGGFGVGEVIDLERYRARAGDKERNGLFVEIHPPVILVKCYEQGVLVEQHRIISEYMLRDLLDEMV
jgi:hypothetical protein